MGKTNRSAAPKQARRVFKQFATNLASTLEQSQGGGRKDASPKTHAGGEKGARP